MKFRKPGLNFQCFKEFDGKVFDAHAHIYRVSDVGPKMQAKQANRKFEYSDWHSTVENHLPNGDILGGLFFPFPDRNGDLASSNDFLIQQLDQNPGSRGLILVDYESAEKSYETWLSHPSVVGFKPYHCYSTKDDSFESRVDEFVPEWAWKVADEKRWVIMLHIAKALSMSDPDNIRDLNRLCTDHPNARVVLAHAGRGFNGSTVQASIESYTGLQNLWFDTSACCDSLAFASVLKAFGPKKLMWGSDFPVSIFKGTCAPVGESFFWMHEDTISTGSSKIPLTLEDVGLESLKALGDAGHELGLSPRDWEDIFSNNALRLIGQSPTSQVSEMARIKERSRITPWGTQLFSKRAELFAPGQWPTHYSEARGCKIWDLDGRCYEDFSTNAVGSCLLGYRDNDVTEAVTRRLQLGSMSSLNCPEEIELGEKLIEVHPWASQVKFARTGGEIAAVAIRLARAKTGKSKIAVSGYHGCHDWYLAASLQKTDSLDQHVMPGLSAIGVPRELGGTTLTFKSGDVDGFMELMETAGTDMAAVIMEPCRYALPDAEFLGMVREETKKRNIILIFDEISIGWRLDFGGAHLRTKVDPDMAIFAKALGNGHPIAAVLGTADSMEKAEQCFLSSTYWTEGIGPAAALATLQKMEDLNLCRVIEQTGQQIVEQWNRAARKYSLRIKTSEEGSCFCLAQFQFESEHALALRTLMTQKMLDRNFLASTTVYVTYAHDAAALSRYETAIDEVFRELAELQDQPDAIHSELKGPVVQPSFQRLN